MTNPGTNLYISTLTNNYLLSSPLPPVSCCYTFRILYVVIYLLFYLFICIAFNKL